MPKSEWRSPIAHHHTLSLDPADLAWEFLRRNPDYQAYFAGHSEDPGRKADSAARRWGLRFLVDPRHGAHETSLFWHYRDSAWVIILAPRKERDAAESFVVDDWLMRLPCRRSGDGTHVLLRDGNTRYQILLTTLPRQGVVRAALMPLDVTTPYRGQATRKFWDYAARGHPRPRYVGASRPERLSMALRALDLRLAGATYRSIAETLFGKPSADAPPWKTAAIRDTVIRLVRTGLFMMQGGYRRLLGPGDADAASRVPPR